MPELEDTSAPTGPVGQLPPQPWMSTEGSRAVVAALTSEGHEARFIGGCVRDAILKRPVHDIDIAVPLPPNRVMMLLGRANIKAIPTGIAHGTITAVTGDQHFEITSLRRDVETDGRHAKVAFTDDWRADAARRDFTINAMSCTKDGVIYDYFEGLDDLAHGIIRFVGDAEARIAEDALRLLRFFRFHAHYGRSVPDADALAACRARAADVLNLSGERVRSELLRLLSAEDPCHVIDLMRDEGILAYVLPDAAPGHRFQRLVWLETRAISLASVKGDAVRRLAALLPPEAGAEPVVQRLRLSNDDRVRIDLILRPPFAIRPEAPFPALEQALHHVGVDGTRDLALIAWADELSADVRRQPGRTACWLNVFTRIDAWKPVLFPLRGRDVLDLGIPHGPQIGDLLGEVEAWWEEGGYIADRDACLTRLRALVSSTLP